MKEEIRYVLFGVILGVCVHAHACVHMHICMFPFHNAWPQNCGPVLLSQLLKTGPCEWIGNGRDLGLLSQDQVIELFVLRMCYLWTFQHLGHEARGLCQIPSSPPPLLYNKIRIFCRWLHPQTPTTNIRMDY